MQPTDRVPDADALESRNRAPDAAPHPIGGHPEPDAYEEGESHVHLPPQSLWPLTVAAGVALGTAGLVSTPVISIVGILLLFYGIIMWVQELRHELH
ncbi:MAG TPA: hypothetical protein VF898_01425 [Chloroflexota bacterium]